jgi:hypothetical protein
VRQRPTLNQKSTATRVNLQAKHNLVLKICYNG